MAVILIGGEQHAGDQEQDGRQRDDQCDQDIGAEPETAAVVSERHLFGVVVVAVGAGLGFLRGPLKMLSGLVSQRSGIDRLLPSEVGMANRRHLLEVGTAG